MNAIEYDHDVANWFTAEQVRLLYRNNPLWAEVERGVYGDVVELE